MGLTSLRLSTRITLSALLLVALGALALMFLEEARLREVYVNRRGADLAEAFHTNKLRLTQAIDTLRRDTVFLSNVPPAAGIARAALNDGFDFRDGNTREKWTLRLQETFAAFLAARPDYYELSLVGVADAGRELVRVSQGGGAITVTAPAQLDAKATRPHFQAALGLPPGQVHLSAFGLHHSKGVAAAPHQPALHATVPVYGPDGRIFGMVVIGMDVRRLLASATAGLPRGALAYAGDREGRYLLHPDGARSFAFETGTTERIGIDFPPLASLLDPRMPPSFPLQAVATERGTQYLAAERIHFDGDNPQRYLLLAYHLPWDLGMEAPARIPPQRIVLGFAALLLTCAVVFVVLRRTFAPLEQLTEAAGTIAAGRRELALPRAGDGEIGRLTRAINAMLTELAEREREILRINAGLEQEVAARTGELRAINADLRIAAATFETHDAIVITDAAGDIVRVNRAFTQITGYSAEEVVGKNPRVMSSGCHGPDFYGEMWAQILATGSWAGEITDRRKSGEIYPKWLTITAVRDEAHGAATHYVGIFSDITVRKQAEEEIRSLAFYDVLTGLANRRLFFDRARAVRHASARHGDYGALLFIDMDRFKILNDTLGHDYGDMLLIEVAARLNACVREMDTVARLGGDEFVVLIQAIGRDEADAYRAAALVAEKIREALARPYRLREHEHSSSPSIGVALLHGNDESVEELLQRADMAMYRAKESGRNAVCLFDPLVERAETARAASVHI